MLRTAKFMTAPKPRIIGSNLNFEHCHYQFRIKIYIRTTQENYNHQIIIFQNVPQHTWWSDDEACWKWYVMTMERDEIDYDYMYTKWWNIEMTKMKIRTTHHNKLVIVRALRCAETLWVRIPSAQFTNSTRNEPWLISVGRYTLQFRISHQNTMNLTSIATRIHKCLQVVSPVCEKPAGPADNECCTTCQHTH